MPIDMDDLEGVIMFERVFPENKYAHRDCAEIEEDILIV
jgi:hypothetical protein